MKRPLLILSAIIASASIAAAQMPANGRNYGPNHGSGYGVGNQPGYGAPAGPQQNPYGAPAGRGASPYAGPNGSFGAAPGQQQINLQSLVGQWNFSTQRGPDPVPYQVQIMPNGQIQATQRLSVGGVSRIVAQFQGATAQGQIISPNLKGGRPLVNPVQMQFDGHCHINFAMYGKGVPPATGVMHINHRAGEPCPTK